MHANVAVKEFVVFGKAADTEEGCEYREFKFFGEGFELFGGVCDDDPVPCNDEGFFSFFDEASGFFDLEETAFELWFVAREADSEFFVVVYGEFHRSVLDVFGDVNDDGTWASVGAEIVGFLDDAGEIGDIFDEVVVFADGYGDTDDVGFLECVGADEG